jgi:hypothetical protein
VSWHSFVLCYAFFFSQRYVFLGWSLSYVCSFAGVCVCVDRDANTGITIKSKNQVKTSLSGFLITTAWLSLGCGGNGLQNSSECNELAVADTLQEANLQLPIVVQGYWR